MALICLLCQTRPRHSAHPNTKYCEPCRQARLARPRSTLTPEQGAVVLRLAGQIPQRDLCQQLGITKVAITRYLRDQGVQAGHYNTYKSAVITAVCTAYATLGKVRTQALFPDVNVRSIVERHRDQFLPRQIRWTEPQVLEAVRMAGLVSPQRQAQYFGRPNAYGGSIKRLWVQRFGCAPRDLNGLAAHTVWRLVRPGCPALLVPYQQTNAPRAMVLWLDLVHWLRPDVDPLVRQMVETMARWQAWLWGTDDPMVIRTFVAERSGYARDHGPDEWHAYDPLADPDRGAI